MNSWLLDASVLLASEDSDDTHYRDAVRLLSAADPLWTLELAFYEVANVAVRSWRDMPAADRLRARVTAIGADGGLVRADPVLLQSAAVIAEQRALSVYDAAYVAAAEVANCRLVSCDMRDLVSKQLAVLPADALAVTASSQRIVIADRHSGSS